MAKVVATVKFVFVWLYNLCFAWIPSVLVQIDVAMSSFAVNFLVVMIFVPELLYAFQPDFRNWIKGGAEGGDGVLDKSDLSDLIPLYMGLWCTRIFIYFSWQISNGKEIPMDFYLTPLGGALGLGLIPIIRRFVVVAKRFLESLTAKMNTEK